jgi:hypothetical protein
MSDILNFNVNEEPCGKTAGYLAGVVEVVTGLRKARPADSSERSAYSSGHVYRSSSFQRFYGQEGPALP